MSKTDQFLTKSAYETFQTFQALKYHFSRDSYDYFKYNGRARTSVDAFKKNKDMRHFYNLSKKSKQMRHDIILANMLYDEGSWVGTVSSDEGEAIYRAWAKRVSGLEYHFKKELSCMLDDFKGNFKVENGQHPHVMNMLIRGEMSIETFTILANITKIFSYWSEEISDPVVATRINKKARKYHPFLSYNTAQYRNTIKQYFNI